LSEKKCTLCDAIKIYESNGFSRSEAVSKATIEFYSGNDACVSRKIKILKDEHPDWSNDKCVAAAISICKN
jgi:hypothetical protein